MVSSWPSTGPEQIPGCAAIADDWHRHFLPRLGRRNVRCHCLRRRNFADWLRCALNWGNLDSVELVQIREACQDLSFSRLDVSTRRTPLPKSSQQSSDKVQHFDYHGPRVFAFVCRHLALSEQPAAWGLRHTAWGHSALCCRVGDTVSEEEERVGIRFFHQS